MVIFYYGGRERVKPLKNYNGDEVPLQFSRVMTDKT
jgi:hypothetical protein